MLKCYVPNKEIHLYLYVLFWGDILKKLSSYVDEQLIRIAISTAICAILSEFVWDKLQAMTACCAVMMDTLATAKFSFKSNLNRVLATLIGAVFATLATFAANTVNIPAVTILFVVIGAVLTVIGCKLVKLPYILTRIGAIYFIVLFYTPSYQPIYLNSLFRIISVFEAGVVVALVAIVWDFIAVHIFHKERKPAEPAFGGK